MNYLNKSQHLELFFDLCCCCVIFSPSFQHFVVELIYANDMLSYTREQLLSFRERATRISRSVRKVLFDLYLWRPAWARAQARDTTSGVHRSTQHIESTATAGSPASRMRPPTTLLRPEPQPMKNNNNNIRIKTLLNNKSPKVDHLSIGSFNAQSIRNKTASVLNIISENNLDILSVVETWTEPDDISLRMITLDGFVCVDNPRTQEVSGDRRARGGGVALVFRNVFHYRKLEFDLKPKTFEFLAVMLTLGGTRTVVVTIYRPDGKNNAFHSEFERLLEMIVVYNCGLLYWAISTSVLTSSPTLPQ